MRNGLAGFRIHKDIDFRGLDDEPFLAQIVYDALENRGDGVAAIG